MLGYTPKIVVFHHSAGMSGFTAIRKHHKSGNGWSELGYNMVIERSGNVRPGRPIGTTPAAQRGKNSGSVAVCAIGNNLVGGQEWTPAQIASCQRVLDGLRLLYPGIKLFGHKDLGSTECPGLDIHSVLK